MVSPTDRLVNILFDVLRDNPRYFTVAGVISFVLVADYGLLWSIMGSLATVFTVVSPWL